MSELQTAQKAAESEWLDKWTEGPREKASRLLSRGTSAPDLALSDEAGDIRQLAEFWAGGSALVMFWRLSVVRRRALGRRAGLVRRCTRILGPFSSNRNQIPGRKTSAGTTACR